MSDEQPKNSLGFLVPLLGLACLICFFISQALMRQSLQTSLEVQQRNNQLRQQQYQLQQQQFLRQQELQRQELERLRRGR
jgi:hypothetical protein